MLLPIQVSTAENYLINMLIKAHNQFQNRIQHMEKKPLLHPCDILPCTALLTLPGTAAFSPALQR